MNINKNDTAVLVTDSQNDIFISPHYYYSHRPTTGRWMRVMTYLIVLFAVFALTKAAVAQQPSAAMPGVGPNPTLPQPDRAASVEKYSSIVGWPEGRTPTAPPGFGV